MFSTYTTFVNPSSEANHHHHHHQQLPFSSTFLHHQDPPQPLDQFLQLQPVFQYSDGTQQTLIDVVVSRSRSMRSVSNSHRPVKKDRHSKIHTAQGLRDRRVRLSIGIARKFFDLQDMLGFDKASKTLEWLLGNSRNAIKKLARKTNITASLSSSSSSSSSSGDSEATTRKMKRAGGNNLDALARESRAKARARARERTLEKLTSRASKFSQLKANDSISQNLSASSSKPSTLEDQEVPIAREGSYFNNFDNYCPNLPSSWDINSAINAYLCTEAAIHGKNMGSIS